MRSPRLRREHAENARPTTHVKHRLPLEQVRIVHYRGFVRPRSHRVLEHLFMDTYVKHTLVHQRVHHGKETRRNAHTSRRSW